MMDFVDLHIHTNFSDGGLSPKEVIDLAIKSRLSAIAITDHNTIAACSSAIEYSKDKNIEVIPGIEISCHEKELGYFEIHVVGLFIDFNDKNLIEFCKHKNKIDIKQAIKLIKDSGGISILAHPGVYDKKNSIAVIDYFLKSGGDGIETYYPYELIVKLSKKESEELNQFFRDYAKEKHIVQSGGSDFHGHIRYAVKLGESNVPFKVLSKLKELKT